MEAGRVDAAERGQDARKPVALAHAESREDTALGVTEFAAGQAHGNVGAVVPLALARSVGGGAAAGVLRHVRERNAGGNAFERLDHARLLLHRERLVFDGLQARGEFRFGFADATAFQRLFQVLVLFFQALDTLEQFRV